MRRLIIDTATQALSVALFEDGQIIGYRHDIVGRGHAEALMPAIAALPDGGRADAIAVDVGPGSFTGIRVGVAAARALALAWRVSINGYGALQLVAAMAARQAVEPIITVAMTGGHGELFWQQFSQGDLTPLMQPASTPIADLAERLPCQTIFGTGAMALVEARGWGQATLVYPDARAAPLIEGKATLAPRPLYGRGADAQPMALRP